GPTAFRRDAVEFVARREVGAARRREQDRLTIGRPAIDDVGSGIERQAARLAALDRSNENVGAAVAVRREGQLPPIRARERIDVIRLVHGHGPGNAADRLNRPEAAEVAEGDKFTVRRDIGRPGAADWLLGTTDA